MTNTTERFLSAAEILKRVGALGTLIEEEADAVNRCQHLTDELRDTFRAAGAFRICFPTKDWNGPEMWLDDQVRMIESIAYHDASTAWDVMVLADSGAFAPLLHPEGARELYPGLDLATAGSTRPAGRAIRTDGAVNGPLADLERSYQHEGAPI